MYTITLNYVREAYNKYLLNAHRVFSLGEVL